MPPTTPAWKTEQNSIRLIRLKKELPVAKKGDTIFVKTGNYSPLGGELKLRPGTILFGENPINTIITANIRDTARAVLPIEVHNLTFDAFYCHRARNENIQYSKPCQIKNNICKVIAVAHGGGYLGEESVFKPIPFFHIENNTVSDEITFSHGAGKIVGKNIVRNNTAESISLKHGAVTAPLKQPEPGFGYLIENNTVTGEILFAQGASVDSTMTEIIKDLTKIDVSKNKADIIEIRCGAGYTYLLDKNTIQNGIGDSSAACWTTISNNTIINGRITDVSGGGIGCDDINKCMVEDQFIENNTIYFEAAGDPDDDFAIIAKSRSVTIRGNKITCKGAASGIQLKSGGPTNVINNVITVEPGAEFGIETKAGYGMVTGNKITGGKIGYHSKSGAVLFEGNSITGSHWGFYSKGNEEVKNNTISNCSGHGMVLDGLRGPVHNNTVTNNDSTGIWVLRNVDLGGGNKNGVGRNIIRGNGYYDMRISINAVNPDTLFINNNVWDHETIADILKYDILNESTGGKLFLDFKSIIAKPAVAQLVSPANLAILTTCPALMSWQPVATAETYRLQVSTDSGFGTLLLDTMVTATSFSVSNLPNQAVYHWRLQAANLAGESNWSETRQFSTLITGINVNILEKEGVEVWPNPTTGKFKVQGLKFKVEGVEVVDFYGRSLFAGVVEPGIAEQEFDIGHLPAGIYFVRILSENQITVKKIIKL